MNLTTFEFNGERIAFITLFGDNRSAEVTNWHHRVMVGHFGLPVNYIQAPFPSVSHGYMMNAILQATVDRKDAPDYYWWLDNDALVLRSEAIEDAYYTVRNKRTLWGQAWNSAHKAKVRGGTHPYASQACMLLPRELYVALDRPDCDHHNPRSDTAEELTYAVEEAGFTLALQYPTQSDEPYTVDLSQTCRYGRGIVYGGNRTYHETRADLPGHAERFVVTAQRVITGEFNA